MTWLTILGLTLPSVAVIVAVYLMFRQYFRHQQQQFILRSKQRYADKTLPLKLQAYERLTLLCERIEIPELLLRLRAQGTSAGELQATLLLAIQQEFEHNVTQQLYVSEELWKIMMLAKTKTMDLIAIAMDKLPATATGDAFAQRLIDLASKEDQLPSQIARKAIKTEAAILL